MKSSSIFLLILAQSACAQSNEPQFLPIDKVALSAITAGGAVEFQVEIAKTPAERAQGLMFRAKLPQNRGMLFVFDEEGSQAFWMKNTPEPLDIIYIAQDGKLVSIKKGEPFSTDPIASDGQAQFVLELASGEALRTGLKKGDVFSHPVIAAASNQ